MTGNKKNKLFCICGETASGKDTLINSMKDKFLNKLVPVCSYATRPKRENETDGIEHYFITEDEFNVLKESKKDNILAYTRISVPGTIEGYQYMALSDELERANLYSIDPNGIEFLKENYNDKIDIVIIYIFAPLNQRRLRAKKVRSDFDAEFEKRVRCEEEQFSKFKEYKKYDYIIYNFDDCFSATEKTLETIINYEMNGGCKQ